MPKSNIWVADYDRGALDSGEGEACISNILRLLLKADKITQINYRHWEIWSPQTYMEYFSEDNVLQEGRNCKQRWAVPTTHSLLSQGSRCSQIQALIFTSLSLPNHIIYVKSNRIYWDSSNFGAGQFLC